MTREWHPRALAQISIRSLQFLFACISAAVYAVDLAKWSSASIHANPNWIYAEVVSVLSVLSCIAQWWLALRPAVSALWDSILCLLWLVTVAVFGQLLSGHDDAPDGGYSRGRVGAAVGIDILNILLWLASAVEVCLCCNGARKAKQHEGPETTELANEFTTENVQIPDERPPSYRDLAENKVIEKM